MPAIASNLKPGGVTVPGQRLLAQLDLVKEPDVVLGDAKYWTPEFVRHFIDSWGPVAFADHRAGMRLAEVAVELVNRLDAADRRVLRPRALALMGSSYRAKGDLARADKILAEVGTLYEDGTLPRVDEADHARRVAYLRMDQCRYAEAVDQANKTIRLCEAECADHELGLGYAARGACFLWMLLNGESIPTGEPVASLSQAIKGINPKRGLHSYEAATQNLALTLLEGPAFDFKQALQVLKKAARLQAKLRIGRKTLPNAQLRWALGLVYLRAGMLQRAQELLRRSRLVLREFGLQHHEVWISLDLARVYSRLGHFGKLRVLVEELLAVKGVHTREGLAALTAWHEAVRREEVTHRVWQRVLDTVRWPQAPHWKRLRRQREDLSRRQSPPHRRMW